METKIINISEKLIGKRLDVALTEVCGDISRSFVQKLIKEGKVKLDGVLVSDYSKKILKFCVAELNFEDDIDESDIPVAQDIPIKIVYEDEYLIVVDKPFGMVCHPSLGHKDKTLVNAVMWHCKESGESLSDFGGSDRLGIVHRLDKDTSGLIVIAKNNEVHRKLSEMFAKSKGDKITRKYICFVFNTPSPKEGRIDTLITRNSRLRQQYCVSEDQGKRSITIYKTLNIKYITSTKSICMLECELLTGRTHQIRVHMKHIGCPIIGDKVYSKKKIEHTYPKIVSDFERQALHSRELCFVHPITFRRMSFSSDLPKDLMQIYALF